MRHRLEARICPRCGEPFVASARTVEPHCAPCQGARAAQTAAGARGAFREASGPTRAAPIPRVIAAGRHVNAPREEE